MSNEINDFLPTDLAEYTKKQTQHALWVVNFAYAIRLLANVTKRPISWKWRSEIADDLFEHISSNIERSKRKN